VRFPRDRYNEGSDQDHPNFGNEDILVKTPGQLAAETEHLSLPAGDGERFSGYGVMGQPFRSGHVLAMRRFARNSIGPAYSAVWYGDPDSQWTMWTDVPPLQACPRYFGPALIAAEQRDIELRWLDAWTLHVRIDGVLEWHTRIERTPATRAMTLAGSHLPTALWRNSTVLAAMGRLAGPMLGAGMIRLNGRVPSQQWFKVNPKYVWATTEVDATLCGEPLGEPGPIVPQRHLGGFPIPNRGLFAVGRAIFETYDADRHVQSTPARF
jgi:hypothetical protein